MYPTDLSDCERERIEAFFKIDYSKGGRPLKYSKRQILNAIFYVAKRDVSGDFFQRIIPHEKGFITILESGKWKGFLRD